MICDLILGCSLPSQLERKIQFMTHGSGAVNVRGQILETEITDTLYSWLTDEITHVGDPMRPGKKKNKPESLRNRTQFPYL